MGKTPERRTVAGMVQLCAWIPPELADKLKARAKLERTSQRVEVVEALKAYLAPKVPEAHRK